LFNCFEQRFLLAGVLYTFFEIGGNVDELKAYRLIPLTTPLPGHFTVPLNIRARSFLSSYSIISGTPSTGVKYVSLMMMTAIG
jgi:hypothetical protein